MTKRDALEYENRRLRAAIINQTGDNECWIKERPCPLPPLPEFLESCRRHHTQLANERGVSREGLTIAELEARVMSLETAAREVIELWTWTDGHPTSETALSTAFRKLRHLVEPAVEL